MIKELSIKEVPRDDATKPAKNPCYLSEESSLLKFQTSPPGHRQDHRVSGKKRKVNDQKSDDTSGCIGSPDTSRKESGPYVSFHWTEVLDSGQTLMMASTGIAKAMNECHRSSCREQSSDAQDLCLGCHTNPIGVFCFVFLNVRGSILVIESYLIKMYCFKNLSDQNCFRFCKEKSDILQR